MVFLQTRGMNWTCRGGLRVIRSWEKYHEHIMKIMKMLRPRLCFDIWLGTTARHNPPSWRGSGRRGPGGTSYVAESSHYHLFYVPPLGLWFYYPQMTHKYAERERERHTHTQIFIYIYTYAPEVASARILKDTLRYLLQLPSLDSWWCMYVVM